MSARQLFVRSLPWATRNEQLEAYFSKFGRVSSARVILERETQRSRGFGFVTFEDDAVVDSVLNETEHSIGGRPIIVTESEKKSPSYGSNNGSYGGGGDSYSSNRGRDEYMGGGRRSE